MRQVSPSSARKKLPIVVDQVFSDTWLTVCQLRNATLVEDGESLYRKACGQVERAREQLKTMDVSQASIEHMLYAQCALLDESVMNRQSPVQDEGYRQWLKSPLQAKYFNTLDAGEQLWDRIRNVLREPAPDITVLTCFHRVLLLGFSGRYREQYDEQREEVRATLASYVPPFGLAQETPLVVAAGRSRTGRRAVWPWWVLGSALLISLWWGLEFYLRQFVHQVLP